MSGWETPTVQRLTGDRLHLQHGPIDVVLKAFGAPTAIRAAEEAVARRFPMILPELVAELAELRKPLAERPRVEGSVARRMVAACGPHRGVFVTPMVAVAGAVADELLAVMAEAAPLDRAFVNDGGDVAVLLTEGETMEIGLAADFTGGAIPAVAGSARLRHGDGIGGVATSGAQGRSFSLGIADSVTILAKDAASADAAASLVANAVDLPGHPAVVRRPARDLDPDSDLGDLAVTVEVGALSPGDIEVALAAGLAKAERLLAARLIAGAALALQGRVVTTGISRFLARG